MSDISMDTLIRYVVKVRLGEITIADVPEEYKTAVENYFASYTGNSFTNEESLTRLAGVLRSKNGSKKQYRLPRIATEILDLDTSSIGVDAISVTLLNDSMTTLDDSSDTPANATITSLGDYALYKCANLTTVKLPKCTTIGAYAFSKSTSLSSLSIPNCTSVKDYAFDGCTGLTSLGAGIKISSIASNAFKESGLVTFRTSGRCTINSNAFKDCTALTSIDITGLSNFYASFYGCTALESVTLRFDDYVCTIQGDAKTYFRDTPIGRDDNPTGYIYVPEKLIGLYREANRWSSLADRFAVIPPEPEVDDGSDEEEGA